MEEPRDWGLHSQVHPCAVLALEVAPLLAGAEKTEETPHPDGATSTDLKEVRELVYKMQSPDLALHPIRRDSARETTELDSTPKTCVPSRLERAPYGSVP